MDIAGSFGGVCWGTPMFTIGTIDFAGPTACGGP